MPVTDGDGDEIQNDDQNSTLYIIVSKGETVKCKKEEPLVREPWGLGGAYLPMLWGGRECEQALSAECPPGTRECGL